MKQLTLLNKAINYIIHTAISFIYFIFYLSYLIDIQKSIMSDN